MRLEDWPEVSEYRDEDIMVFLDDRAGYYAARRSDGDTRQDLLIAVKYVKAGTYFTPYARPDAHALIHLLIASHE